LAETAQAVEADLIVKLLISQLCCCHATIACDSLLATSTCCFAHFADPQSIPESVNWDDQMPSDIP
jgi:hypothetical protein